MINIKDRQGKNYFIPEGIGIKYLIEPFEDLDKARLSIFNKDKLMDKLVIDLNSENIHSIIDAWTRENPEIENEKPAE